MNKRILALMSVLVIMALIVPALAMARPVNEDQLRISTDKRAYQIGEPVVFTVTNAGREVVQIHPQMGQDGVIYNKITGEVVKMQTPYRTQDARWLEPGETYTWTWDQTYYLWHWQVDPFTGERTIVNSRLNGQQVPSGMYVMDCWGMDITFRVL